MASQLAPMVRALVVALAGIVPIGATGTKLAVIRLAQAQVEAQEHG